MSILFISAVTFEEECVQWKTECDNSVSCNSRGECIGKRKRDVTEVESALPVVQVEELVHGKRVKRGTD